MTASSICFSGSSLASDSTIITASPVPATTRSRSLLAISSIIGLSTNWPSTTPTRAAPIGPEERQARQRQRRGGGDQADDVGIVLHVVRQHGDDDLRLVLEALDEQRPDRPVDQARGQRLLLGGAAFALEKAAGDLAGGVGLLLVVDGQREEVDAGPRRSSRRPRSPARSSRRTGRARRHRPGAPCGPSRASACGRPIRFPRVVFRTSLGLVSRCVASKRHSAAASVAGSRPTCPSCRGNVSSCRSRTSGPASGGFPNAR